MSSVYMFTSEQSSPLSNYYPCKVMMDGKNWSSSLAYYQACKFFGTPEGEKYAEIIRLADKPMKITSLGSMKMRFPATWRLNSSDDRMVSKLIEEFKKQKLAIRADWNNVRDEMMLKALRAKFSQNAELRQLLLETGDQILVENFSDSYWSSGKVNSDGSFSGQNKLGRLLMQVRNELRVMTDIALKKDEFSLVSEEFPPLCEEFTLPEGVDWADLDGPVDWTAVNDKKTLRLPKRLTPPPQEVN